ncbi:MAG: acyl carrier protein [Planctomycetes bacterium]|nr:acyl carrier protein [Planctomycetota bacterium]
MTQARTNGAPSGSGTVIAEIYSLLEPLNQNHIDLTEATDINADLNIDSVAILDLLMTIEDAYDISIPINLLADVRTVGDLADTVRKMIGARAESGSC